MGGAMMMLGDRRGHLVAAGARAGRVAGSSSWMLCLHSSSLMRSGEVAPGWANGSAWKRSHAATTPGLVVAVGRQAIWRKKGSGLLALLAVSLAWAVWKAVRAKQKTSRSLTRFWTACISRKRACMGLCHVHAQGLTCWRPGILLAAGKTYRLARLMAVWLGGHMLL